MFRAKISSFNKTTCWPAGPCKPETTIVEGTAVQVQSAVSTAIQDLGNLTAGESIQIIITYKEDNT